MASASILTVQADDSFAIDLRRKLTQLGYTIVAEVKTGEAALNAASRFCPDIVLIDVRLSDQTDGVEIAKQIRTHRDLPILFMSALADDAIFQRARTAEPDGYLVKPFEIQTLAASIEIALAKHRAEQALKASQEYARDIIESSLDMIIAVDMNRRIIEFNKAAQETFGYRREEVLGTSINLLYADPAESQSVNETTTLQGRTIRQVLNKTKDGRLFPCLLSASVLRDTVGNPIGFMGISRDISEMKRAEEEQKRLFDQVRAGRERMQLLSKQLLQVQENERRHIARELHDEIGQTMTGVQLSLQVIEPLLMDRAARACLEDATRAIERVLHQVRNLSLELRPSLLDDFGLIPALRWLIERQIQRTGLHILFQADPIEPRAPEEIETVCFRVTQEALTNIARHAHARNVWVELRQSHSELQLTIRDDGIGFDVAQAVKYATEGGSMGLLGLQERVILAGGRVEISSTPNQGTRIQAILPGGSSAVPKERRSRRRSHHETDSHFAGG